MSKLAILITVHKPTLSMLEEISLQQCKKILGKEYPIYFVTPRGLDTQYLKSKFPSFKQIIVPYHWMKNYHAFGRMKVQPHLYKIVRDFDFVLFYEPDAFIFQNDLEYWMDKNYDYIGAPWFRGFQNATTTSPFIGVGNGGFSLRKVSSMIKVTHSWRQINSLKTLYQNYKKPLKSRDYISLSKNFLFYNNTFWLLNRICIEDTFWGLLVPDIFPWFRIPEPIEASQFSFEVLPKRLYQLNENKLPTGCHGWAKYEIDFWTPFIQKEGYNL